MDFVVPMTSEDGYDKQTHSYDSSSNVTIGRSCAFAAQSTLALHKFSSTAAQGTFAAKLIL